MQREVVTTGTGTGPQIWWELVLEQEGSHRSSSQKTYIHWKGESTTRALHQRIERCIKWDCGLWQVLMKCQMREEEENLFGKSSLSFLSPTSPGGWYSRRKNEMFKDWQSILWEKQQTKDKDMECWRWDKIMCLTPEKEVRKIIIKLPLDTHVINNCFSSQL